jgi:protein Tex
MNLVSSISTKTWLPLQIVETIINLLDEGNTVPFIARYRKELTGGATDEQLRDFHDIYEYSKNLEARRADILRLIDEKGLLTPELKEQILAAQTLAKLEDLYRPYKEKKLSKASIAKAKGLAPLAELLKLCVLDLAGFLSASEKYIKDTGDAKTSVQSIEEAVQWAKDIVAEEVADHAELREDIRQKLKQKLNMMSKQTKTFEENGVYKIYGAYSKKFDDIPSYAYLALCRAEEEKQLSLSFDWSQTAILGLADSYFVPRNPSDLLETLHDAMLDGIKRLLIPSLEREIRADKKRRSDEAAIKLFGENMKQLLLTPPIRGKIVLGMDPGFRTGCKLAVVDPTGKFLGKDVLMLLNSDLSRAGEQFITILQKYWVSLIVIGNGTASRETTNFVSEMLTKHKLDIPYLVVSEAGASVYSASELAQQEYPHLDVTIRGAISIAQRAQDAMSALTKIEPKAIGVGQYQHDVDQKLLEQKLHEKVEDVVNSVGVDVNTASATLLQYISGLTPTIAKNIVTYRDEHGAFESKAQLKKVKGLWPKAYEQCVGFLRIYGGKEPLDETGIHPEMYDHVYAMMEGEWGMKKKGLKLPLVLT